MKLDCLRSKLPWALLATALGGCGKDPVDPLDCEFPSHVASNSAAAAEPATVDFSADWGSAPQRMKLRVVSADARALSLIGCGRDADDAEWELKAVWHDLPEAPSFPLDVEFFDRARLEAGERQADDDPKFDGSLSRCGSQGCVTIDEVAFAYHYMEVAADNVSGVARITDYDSTAGRFVGSIAADPGSPFEQPPTDVAIDIQWDPALVDPGAGGSSG